MEIKILDFSVEKSFRSLEQKTLAKVLRTIDLLEIFGNRLGMPQKAKNSYLLIVYNVYAILLP
jgi:hypothetical protein